MSEAEAELLREALADIEAVRKLKTGKRQLVKSQAGPRPISQSPGREEELVWTEGTKAAPMRRGALMVALGEAGARLPLWVGKMGEAVPALAGSQAEDPAHVLAPGHAVAALVKGSEEDEHNWILAEVPHSLFLLHSLFLH